MQNNKKYYLLSIDNDSLPCIENTMVKMINVFRECALEISMKIQLGKFILILNFVFACLIKYCRNCSNIIKLKKDQKVNRISATLFKSASRQKFAFVTNCKILEIFRPVLALTVKNTLKLSRRKVIIITMHKVGLKTNLLRPAFSLITILGCMCWIPTNLINLAQFRILSTHIIPLGSNPCSYPIICQFTVHTKKRYIQRRKSFLFHQHIF